MRVGDSSRRSEEIVKKNLELRLSVRLLLLLLLLLLQVSAGPNRTVTQREYSVQFTINPLVCHTNTKNSKLISFSYLFLIYIYIYIFFFCCCCCFFFFFVLFFCFFVFFFVIAVLQREECSCKMFVVLMGLNLFSACVSFVRRWSGD